jgi:N-acetylmuramoyl-L-alanine amidase
VPTRPNGTTTVKGPGLSLRKFGAVDYVNIAEGAARLGLKLTWRERGRTLTLTGDAVRAELEKDTRDVTINGLRVFLGDPILEAGGLLYVSRIDFERCLTPLLKPGFGVNRIGPPRVIVLDPGHGGRDPGNLNARLGIDEKTFALDVARRAKKLLEAAGYRVVLTREGDEGLELARRAAIANVNRADLFVSVHFNALVNDTRTSGMEIYTFAPAHQHSTGWWSERTKGDPHLETTDQPVNRFDHWSVVLAQAIQRRFITDLKVFDRGKKLMHLGMLRGLTCPGVLVECGFLTSEVEARKIATPDYRQKLAEAVAAGVGDYAATLGAIASRP